VAATTQVRLLVGTYWLCYCNNSLGTPLPRQTWSLFLISLDRQTYTKGLLWSKGQTCTLSQNGYGTYMSDYYICYVIVLWTLMRFRQAAWLVSRVEIHRILVFTGSYRILVCIARCRKIPFQDPSWYGIFQHLRCPSSLYSYVTKKLDTLLDLCVSSLRRGHANLLCIVPILTDDPRRESEILRLSIFRIFHLLLLACIILDSLHIDTKITHRGARTHDHKVKGLALCRLS
jgi:hypothetical protein